MKITSDDPRLTALALGELPQEEARLVRAEIEASPELTKELEMTASLAAFLGNAFEDDELTLGSERREQVLRAGQRADADVLILESHKRTRRHTFKVLAGTAAVLVLGFSLLNRTHVAQPSLVDQHGSGSETGSGVPGYGEGYAAFAPVSKPVEVTELTSVSLPLDLAQPDFNAVEQWLSAQRSALPSELSQTALWINAITPREEPLVTLLDLGLWAELSECPWDSEKKLLMIVVRSLRSDDDLAHSVMGTLELEPDRVNSVKLLSGAGTGTIAKGMVTLPAGGNQVLLYELVLEQGLKRLGAIHLDTMNPSDEERSAYLPIPAQSKPSQDFEMAVLMAEFARWNQSSQDGAQLQDLARRAEKLFPIVTDQAARKALDLILLARDLVN